MAFTRNPSTGLPATYTGTNEVDSLVLIDQPSQITIKGLDANDSVIVTAAALDNRALSGYLIYGNDGSDSITISQANTFSGSLIQGGNGDDGISVTALTTGSTIRGGADNDQISVSGLSASTVNGNKGSDTVTATGLISNSRVFGGSEDDTVNINFASMRNSRANGSAGSDTMNIGNGTTMVDSTVFGGAGNDFINANNNDNNLSVSGDDGNDIVTFGAVTADGDNSIVTGSGNDEVELIFATGDSTINTGVGADTITLGVGVTGANTIEFNRGDSVASTANTLGAGGTGLIADTNTITFGNGVDVISGFTTGDDQVALDFNAAGLVTILDGSALNQVLATNTVYFIEGTLAGTAFTVDDNAASGIYIFSGANQTLTQAINTSTSIMYSDSAIALGDLA